MICWAYLKGMMMGIIDVNAAQSEIEQLRALALGLAQQWENRSRRKFMDAKVEESQTGKRLIEHGAMCYFNAASETRSAFGLPELTPNKEVSGASHDDR